MYSKTGSRIFKSDRIYTIGKYACYMMSRTPQVPFLECWAVVDDYGNLVAV